MYILLSINPFFKPKFPLLYIKFRIICKLNLQTDYNKGPSKIYGIMGIIWICVVIASQAIKTTASFPHSKSTVNVLCQFKMTSDSLY